MNDIIKWFLKFALQGIAWVFVLSINIGGMTIFDRMHGVFIQNALVQSLDEEVADIWRKVTKTAETSFEKEKAEKKM